MAQGICTTKEGDLKDGNMKVGKGNFFSFRMGVECRQIQFEDQQRACAIHGRV